MGGRGRELAHDGWVGGVPGGREDGLADGDRGPRRDAAAGQRGGLPPVRGEEGHLPADAARRDGDVPCALRAGPGLHRPLVPGVNPEFRDAGELAAHRPGGQVRPGPERALQVLPVDRVPAVLDAGDVAGHDLRVRDHPRRVQGGQVGQGEQRLLARPPPGLAGHGLVPPRGPARSRRGRAARLALPGETGGGLSSGMAQAPGRRHGPDGTPGRRARHGGSRSCRGEARPCAGGPAGIRARTARRRGRR